MVFVAKQVCLALCLSKPAFFFVFFFFFFFNIFWPHWVLVLACEILVPRSGMEPVPASWGSLCSPMQSDGPPDHQGSLKPAFSNDHWLTGVFHTFFLYLQSPSGMRAPLVTQMVKNLPAMPETWVGKIPWRRAWQSTPVFLPGESPWTKEPGGYSSWGHKESDMTESLSTHVHRVGWSI